jgi:hypothetical protein
LNDDDDVILSKVKKAIWKTHEVSQSSLDEKLFIYILVYNVTMATVQSMCVCYMMWDVLSKRIVWACDITISVRVCWVKPYCIEVIISLKRKEKKKRFFDPHVVIRGRKKVIEFNVMIYIIEVWGRALIVWWNLLS